MLAEAERPFYISIKGTDSAICYLLSVNFLLRNLTPYLERRLLYTKEGGYCPVS
jgi:hypothetical protein